MYLVSLNYSLKSGLNGKFYIICTLPQYFEHYYWIHEWAEMRYTRKEEQRKEAIPTILPGSPWGSFWLIATTPPSPSPSTTGSQNSLRERVFPILSHGRAEPNLLSGSSHLWLQAVPWLEDNRWMGDPVAIAATMTGAKLRPKPAHRPEHRRACNVERIAEKESRSLDGVMNLRNKPHLKSARPAPGLFICMSQ